MLLWKDNKVEVVRDTYNGPEDKLVNLDLPQEVGHLIHQVNYLGEWVDRERGDPPVQGNITKLRLDKFEDVDSGWSWKGLK